MADLCSDRLEDTPPFQSAGEDCFGPFYINKGKVTHSSLPTVKIWVVVFGCLPSRAIHLEPLDMLDMSSFINALSCFSAVRGTSRLLRSDRGTNFVGACDELPNIDLDKVSLSLSKNNISWVMNPPCSSHYRGIWERRIGSMRRVFEGALLQLSKRSLSRDAFVTLLQESSAIGNNTPLWAVSKDPSNPLPLALSTLLTLREHPHHSPVDSFTEANLDA